MKKSAKFFILTLSVLVCAFVVSAQDPNEIAAIKAAIEKETTAYFRCDYKTWMDSWVHEPHAFWSVSDTSGFNTFEGWKAIEIGFTDHFVTSKPSAATFSRKWYDIRVYGNGAFARFVQYTTDEGVTTTEDELRVLEKHKNQWKIVFVGVMKGNQKGKL